MLVHSRADDTYMAVHLIFQKKIKKEQLINKFPNNYHPIMQHAIMSV